MKGSLKDKVGLSFKLTKWGGLSESEKAKNIHS